MYPPPHCDVIARLIGQAIETISFGIYVAHLSFESGDKLSVACPFRFGPNEAESPLNEFPIRETNLPLALGSKVAEVACDVDGTLRLRLSNGFLLIAYANDPGYEAYTLVINGKEYVV
jgi:hypothetical protein